MTHTRSVLLALAVVLLAALAAPATASAAPLKLPPGYGTPAFSLMSDVGSGVDDGTVALMVKLQTAQFHHLRAMHGIGWALTGMLVSPSLIVIGGGVMIAGFVGGIFTGNNAVLIGGIVMVGIGAALLIAGVPTLIGNVIQAMATSARVEDLRAQLLNRHAVVRTPARPDRHASLSVTLAF